MLIPQELQLSLNSLIELLLLLEKDVSKVKLKS